MSQKLINDVQVALKEAVDNLLIYDRKEDNNLGIGMIEEAIAKGLFTVDDMMTFLRARLILSINEYNQKNL